MNTNAQERRRFAVNPANRRKCLNIEFVRAHSRRSRAAGFCFYILPSTSCFDIQNSGSLRPSDFVIIDRLWAAGVNWTMRFRRVGITLGLLLMAAFVYAGQTASGIEGVITISPIRAGPARADAPISRPLANAAFAVENQKGEIASFTTDNEGRFRVSLAPGHYKVSLKGRTSSIGRYGPFEVDVAAGQMTKVQWECDSGMR
jgi:hypothetical protein